MAVVDTPVHDDHHDDHHHDHGEFIAHHFDSAEQQFDSGKLGIWIFLTTEVLFFSGLFVAYTLYRSHHPEIFEQAHVYLDKYLGGLNTIVLLFSSLTMALAVRSAQLARNKNCAMYTLVTMVCATVFLGVKAVEYSHKWDMGIFVRSGFSLTGEHAHPTLEISKALGISDYLVYISAIPAILLTGFVIASVMAKVTNKDLLAKFMAGLAITVGGYFLGAAGGQVFQNARSAAEGESSGHAAIVAEPLMLHAASLPETETETAQADKATDKATDKTSKASSTASDDDHAHEDGHSHDADPHAHDESGQEAGHDETQHDDAHAAVSHTDPNAGLDPDVGIFFSIYYCMTGLHAIHIVGGIIALSWIFWRSLAGHWRSDYFGPVDYVGLYWHLVDLIWIYLFPLLYLID